MACEQIKARLESLSALRQEISQELKDLPVGSSPEERSALLQEFKQIGPQISATQLSLKQCLNAATAPPITVAPPNILEIKQVNPEFHPGTADWAKTIAGGTYPENSGKEWKQVLAPEEEYDEFTLVGASGWVLQPEISGSDLPFSHPFGVDWEFSLAPDLPYANLLAPGNAQDNFKAPIMRANDLHIPVPKGVLGVEWDAGHVPLSFREQVREGNRAAVFGRWIVDCGHDDFHTEIHPPLLVACGSTKLESDGSQGTRVLFTSRPYLVGQRFTVDTNDIYHDAADDDGEFYSHMLHEVIKINEHASLLVEAHPKIKSHPFLGAHLLHLVIRPPSPTGLHITSPFERLVVSFHFTVRTGCAVQVASTTTGAVDVFIALSHGGYTPPPLPNRRGRRYSRAELDTLKNGVGQQIFNVEKISAAIQVLLPGSVISSLLVTALLERGVETDEYDALKDVNVLDSGQAVTNVFADSIPAGMGVSHDDQQPFPVYGWLEVKRVQSAIVHA